MLRPSRLRKNKPSVVWRELTAYEVSICWRDPDGTVHFPALGETPDPGAEIGSVRLFVAFDLDGNRIPDGPTFTRCTLDPVLPVLPPPAPTPQQIWDEVPLPQPEVTLSPRSPGLVGLESWFWSNVADSPVTVQVRLGPWTATVTAEPTEYRWSTADTLLGTADHPGDEDHPAVRHAFIRQGEVTITHTVVWSGTFTLTGPLAVSSQSLGTVEPSASAPYAIREIEAVVVG